MLLRYALIGAAAFAVAGIAGARAQSPFPPVGQQSPFPPVGQQSPFPSPETQSLPPSMGQPQQQQQQQQQANPCVEQFNPLRLEVDKRFDAAKAALAKHAGPAELCGLLTRFTEAENKMVKYVQENGARCNFPPNALPSMLASQVKSGGYKKAACEAAAAPPRPARPAEPTLSDAFSPPAVNKNNTRTGGGTLDSLSGNPLAR